MPKKKRPPRPGQFGAPALAGLAKRRKAEELQNAAAAQLRVLQQDKGPAGNSIAETARSVGQAALETARRAAAKHAAEQEWDQEQDRQVKVEVERLVDDVEEVDRLEREQELMEGKELLYRAGVACPLCDRKAASLWSGPGRTRSRWIDCLESASGRRPRYDSAGRPQYEGRGPWRGECYACVCYGKPCQGVNCRYHRRLQDGFRHLKDAFQREEMQPRAEPSWDAVLRKAKFRRMDPVNGRMTAMSSADDRHIAEDACCAAIWRWEKPQHDYSRGKLIVLPQGPFEDPVIANGWSAFVQRKELGPDVGRCVGAVIDTPRIYEHHDGDVYKDTQYKVYGMVRSEIYGGQAHGGVWNGDAFYGDAWRHRFVRGKHTYNPIPGTSVRRGSHVRYSSAPGWLARTHAQRVRAPSVGLIVERVPLSRQPKVRPPESEILFALRRFLGDPHEMLASHRRWREGRESARQERTETRAKLAEYWKKNPQKLSGYKDSRQEFRRETVRIARAGESKLDIRERAEEERREREVAETVAVRQQILALLEGPVAAEAAFNELISPPRPALLRPTFALLDELIAEVATDVATDQIAQAVIAQAVLNELIVESVEEQVTKQVVHEAAFPWWSHMCRDCTQDRRNALLRMQGRQTEEYLPNFGGYTFQRRRNALWRMQNRQTEEYFPNFGGYTFGPTCGRHKYVQEQKRLADRREEERFSKESKGACILCVCDRAGDLNAELATRLHDCIIESFICSTGVRQLHGDDPMGHYARDLFGVVQCWKHSSDKTWPAGTYAVMSTEHGGEPSFSGVHPYFKYADDPRIGVEMRDGVPWLYHAEDDPVPSDDDIYLEFPMSQLVNTVNNVNINELTINGRAWTEEQNVGVRILGGPLCPDHEPLLRVAGTRIHRLCCKNPLDGYYRQTGTFNAKPAYAHINHMVPSRIYWTGERWLMHHLKYGGSSSGCRYCRRAGRSDAQVRIEGRSDLCGCYAGENDGTWYDNPQDSETPPMDGWTLRVHRFNDIENRDSWDPTLREGCERCGGRGCGVAEAVEEARWTEAKEWDKVMTCLGDETICWDPTLRDFRCQRPGEALVSDGWCDEAMCPTDMLVVPSLTWIGGLPQCQRHAQMRWDRKEKKDAAGQREHIRLRLKPKYHERKRRLGFRVSGFLREVANFYGLNCDFSSYYWPSLSE